MVYNSMTPGHLIRTLYFFYVKSTLFVKFNLYGVKQIHSGLTLFLLKVPSTIHCLIKIIPVQCSGNFNEPYDECLYPKQGHIHGPIQVQSAYTARIQLHKLKLTNKLDSLLQSRIRRTTEAKQKTFLAQSVSMRHAPLGFIQGVVGPSL